MTTPKPSDEAVEAAMRYSLGGLTHEDMATLSHQPETVVFWGMTERPLTCAHILAAALHHERCELGHANDLLDQIQALVDGHGVGLRDDVRDVLKKRGA